MKDKVNKVNGEISVPIVCVIYYAAYIGFKFTHNGIFEYVLYVICNTVKVCTDEHNEMF